MKPVRPVKRSVSPFASFAPVQDILHQSSNDSILHSLEKEIAVQWGSPTEAIPKELKTLDDIKNMPSLIGHIAEAPANDAPELSSLCHFLILYQAQIQEKKIAELVYGAMHWLFQKKTGLFLIDHYNKEHCEKMGWSDDHRNIVLFAKERDVLVGRFFAPMAELQPGKFSEFITQWVESDNKDTLLHFLDFCSGSKNPTFEHYLLFSHPALSRVIRDKNLLKSIFENVQPLLEKLTSPTWEKEARSALGV